MRQRTKNQRPVRAGAQKRATAKGEHAASVGGETFRCPECGRVFARPAALGAHRRRTHQIIGARSLKPNNDSRRENRSPGSGGPSAIDRDVLLRELFPNGLPPQEAVIRAVNNWLDEAERLAELGAGKAVVR
jgi:hypothetical protein